MGRLAQYRYEATSLRGFIQQIAVGYVRWGYFFYTVAMIPAHKDPRKTDEKIIGRYNLRRSRWSNARAKEQGKASAHYLRYDRTLVLLATNGEHALWAEENLKDLRREPLKVFGYAIGYNGREGQGRGHVSVRIQKPIYLELKARLSDMATKRDVTSMLKEFEKVHFEAYAGVRGQMLNILREVNRRRIAAGMERVPMDAIRMRRTAVKVFQAENAFEG